MSERATLRDCLQVLWDLSEAFGETRFARYREGMADMGNSFADPGGYLSTELISSTTEGVSTATESVSSTIEPICTSSQALFLAREGFWRGHRRSWDALHLFWRAFQSL